MLISISKETPHNYGNVSLKRNMTLGTSQQRGMHKIIFLHVYFLSIPHPRQGAQSSLYAATSSDLVEKNVLFIHDNKEMTASAMARDPEVALKLWKASERRVQLGQHPEDKGCILSEPK